MIEITDKSKCTGCNACKSVCPKQCIIMKSDQEGFWYPSVIKTECIQCGLCDKTCPVLTRKSEVQFQKAYAAYSRDDGIRMESSSGGIFTLLAEHIIDNGGVVFGAAFNAEWKVEHICVDNKEDLAKLRMSKYVQSDIGDTFRQAKDYLESERLVLFTGTPCQIAGLKKYLGKEYDNLCTQDIVCHGVPSPIIWKQYIDSKLSSDKKGIENVLFRCKATGWRDYSIKYEYHDNKQEMVPQTQDVYYQAFLKNLILRPSCYDCRFKGNSLASDITLADFWGIEKVIPEMDDNKGTSLAICHTPKGKTLFESIQSSIVFRSVDYDLALQGNPAAVRSMGKPGSRDTMFHYLQKHPINETLELFTGESDASIRKVQLLEDYEDIKKQRGAIFAKLWYIKNNLV